VSQFDAPATWVIRTAVNANISRWMERRREHRVEPDSETTFSLARPVANDQS
jgi:DNA-directed RNA polymerase specialized sigma24 family protein